jgi:enoyl-CoA hydratase
MTVATNDLLAYDSNGIGVVTLNRPEAINSLNQSMVTTMHAVLTDWEMDDDVHTVVLTGAGDRGLCAGGDVVAVYHSARADGAEARRFWHDEYLLNARIARYPKPFVTLMDGIVMGGGVGVGAHAGVRVVTDATKMAMPEVGIGFIPDVDGTYLLGRAPGRLGHHVALTAAPFSGADAIAIACLIDEAQFHQDRLADNVDGWAADGEYMPEGLRVRARMDIGRALDLCRTAANLIFSLGGGSGIARSNPVQRLFRDVQAGNSHPLQMATVQYEVYGRHMLGQPQITPYI